MIVVAFSVFSVPCSVFSVRVWAAGDGASQQWGMIRRVRGRALFPYGALITLNDPYLGNDSGLEIGDRRVGRVVGLGKGKEIPAEGEEWILYLPIVSPDDVPR